MSAEKVHAKKVLFSLLRVLHLCINSLRVKYLFFSVEKQDLTKWVV